MTQRTYLRFTGRIWDTGEFQLGVGWETPRVRRCVQPTCGFKLALLDRAGSVLLTNGVEVRGPACSSTRGRGMASRRVSGYIGLHPDAGSIALQQNDRILYRASIAERPPELHSVTVNVDRTGRIQAKWKADHSAPLYYNVFLTDPQHRVIPIARELKEPHLLTPQTGLPGGHGCTLSVLATDGLRSSTLRSAAFDLPVPPPYLVILNPFENEVLPPDQPFSLIGSAHDPVGRRLPNQRLVWSIDDVVVETGSDTVLAGPLPPGLHRVVLTVHQDGQTPSAHQSIDIRIAERTGAQEQWHAISSERTRMYKSGLSRPPRER